MQGVHQTPTPCAFTWGHGAGNCQCFESYTIFVSRTLASPIVMLRGNASPLHTHIYAWVKIMLDSDRLLDVVGRLLELPTTSASDRWDSLPSLSETSGRSGSFMCLLRAGPPTIPRLPLYTTEQMFGASDRPPNSRVYQLFNLPRLSGGRKALSSGGPIRQEARVWPGINP